MDRRQQAGRPQPQLVAGERPRGAIAPGPSRPKGVVLNRPAPRRYGIYLLPNLFTTAALAAGFHACIAATEGHFGLAAGSILLAMILDGLDGRIARLTRSESAFGGQYDSLADMVSFGVAPALTTYLWAADTLGRIGVAAAFLFTAAVALRLARFNTQAGNHDRRYFQGLPSPAGAAVIASLIWLAESMPFLEGSLRAPLTALLLVLIAGLMVSRLRYRSFKDFDLSGRVPFLIVAVAVLGAGLLFSAPRTTAFAISAGYVVSGPLGTLQALLRLRRERRRLSPP